MNKFHLNIRYLSWNLTHIYKDYNSHFKLLIFYHLQTKSYLIVKGFHFISKNKTNY